MLQRIKAERDLTVLLTTHYMDEADKLCDRIAIVDHGELKALDSPMKLKASVPGKNVLEVSFAARAGRLGGDAAGAAGRRRRRPAHDNVFRIASSNGPATTMALMEAAARAGVAVQSLSVQSTTLDDVFVHYTGRALRDALQDAVGRRTVPFMMRQGMSPCIARWRHHRTRAAPVPPQPDADRHVDDLADRPARRARLRVRRQRQAPEGRPSSIRTTACRR